MQRPSRGNGTGAKSTPSGRRVDASHGSPAPGHRTEDAPQSADPKWMRPRRAVPENVPEMGGDAYPRSVAQRFFSAYASKGCCRCDRSHS